MSGQRVSGRTPGIDIARAFAGIIMIQGHAYDAWVSPDSKQTVAYAFTRVLGSLPLPAFLLLAGAAVAWRTGAAASRGESARKVRRRVIFRGLQIVVWGYVMSAAYALMDGFEGLDTFLRADVLHVIGLSIAAVGWVGIRPARGRGAEQAPDEARLQRSAVVVGLAVTLLCPWVSRVSPETTGPLRYLVGLFADVPGVTRMPFVPLAAWFCAGVLAAGVMLRAREASHDDSPAGAPARTLWAMAAVGLGGWVVGSLGTDAMLSLMGGELSRRHPAVWLNVVDLAGRALLVLSLGALVANRVRGRAKAALLVIGRGSLVAYVFHLPFCYGALGRPIEGRLDMVQATALMLVLVAASWGAVWVRDQLRGVVGAQVGMKKRG